MRWLLLLSLIATTTGCGGTVATTKTGMGTLPDDIGKRIGEIRPSTAKDSAAEKK